MGQAGPLWWSSVHRDLIFGGTYAQSPQSGTILWPKGDGTFATATFSNGQWSFLDFERLLIAKAEDGWRITDLQGRNFWLYDNAGRLKRTQHADGYWIEATYSSGSTPSQDAPDANRLILLKDSTGRSVGLAYIKTAEGDVVLSRIKDPNGKSIIFEYGSAQNLVAVTWQDGQKRTFLYDSPNALQWWALTGVLDENGRRYATFTYAPEGWAKSTEHAGGVERHEIDYKRPPVASVREVIDHPNRTVWRYKEWSAPEGVRVTQPSGHATDFRVSVVRSGAPGASVQGQLRIGARSQAEGSGCGASTSAIAHESSSGRQISTDDFNGIRTCFGYADAAATWPTTRIEGLKGGVNGNSCIEALAAPSASGLPAEARKISTEWHPQWRLETRRAEPFRLSTWVYNGQPDPFSGGQKASCAPAEAVLPDGQPIAVLCKEVVQATTDANGWLGLAAPVDTAVASRTRTYTYSQFGKLLTSTDEAGNTTTLAYQSNAATGHTLGDVWKQTNAMGHVTEYTRYDARGLPLEMKDPNGIVTTMLYDERGRIKQSTTLGYTTSMEYWPTGLLKSVTQPGNVTLSYAYDDAHRLTSITDALGNRVSYTYDKAGNRTDEAVSDSSGQLLVKVAKTYDNLNRLWTVKAGTQ
ncbi:RHS repeat protein [Aquabacterium lacunae]|nr:RHS repeat protein [Aquabacterium lacunae]